MNNEFFTFAFCKTLEYFNKIYSIASYFTRINSQKIESMDDLYRLINQKKKKHNFNGNITAKLDLEGKITTRALCRKIEDGNYEIVFNKDFLLTKVLDHELYHIFDGHCDNIGDNGFMEALKYSFYKEPKTIFYTLIGKLK